MSYNHQLRRRVGLHLDTWNHVALEARLSSRNILLVNLGRCDRHFLYINLDVVAMRAFVPDASDDPDRLADAFMRRFPNYPVVKLRVSPGEAYIAPVQAVIHDACTDASHQLDIHVAYLGRFDIPGASSQEGLRQSP